MRALARLVQQGVDAELLVAGRLRWIHDPTAACAQADALAKELGLGDRVIFLGPYSQASAPDVFRRADIVLHTKYNDPCPTVVIEAMACGRPVVYSRSGGVPELVGDHAGVGLDAPLSWERDIPPDPDGLAAGVSRVRADLASFAQAARARAVEHFDAKRWVARHREVFDHLVA
jgi:glycosyltransferase involved in cell wall biosynthesis